MTLLPRIEVQPVSHCTLKCSGCQHGVPMRGRRVHQASEYLPHLHRLATFTAWESLIIGGGEPFLHPDLPGFLRECSLGVPTHVITNGYWLLRDDWAEVGGRVFALCAGGIISRYPIYVDRLGVAEWDRRIEVLRERTGCPVSTFHPIDPAGLSFDHHEHHDAPLPIVRACSMRRCLQLLPDGRLARCPLGRWHDRIPRRTAAFVAAYERSGFYSIDRGGEGFAEWAGPEAFEACHYCGLATGNVAVRPWSNG